MGCFRRRGYSTIENRNISSLTKNLVKTHHLHKEIKIDVLFTAHTRQTAKRRRGLEKQGLTLSCFERGEEATRYTRSMARGGQVCTKNTECTEPFSARVTFTNAVTLLSLLSEISLYTVIEIIGINTKFWILFNIWGQTLEFSESKFGLDLERSRA